MTNADRREEEDDNRAILFPFARLSSVVNQPLVSFPKLCLCLKSWIFCQVVLEKKIKKSNLT
jgi:hypothetical protein